MKKKEESNGPYFPVSDTCNRTNDPPERLYLLADVLFPHAHFLFL